MKFLLLLVLLSSCSSRLMIIQTELNGADVKMVVPFERGLKKQLKDSANVRVYIVRENRYLKTL